MTNKQKARQLANYFAGETDMESAAYAYSAVMVMAQWKDEQHAKEKQQWIDKACERLEDYFASDGSMVPENIGLWRDLQRVIKGE